MPRTICPQVKGIYRNNNAPNGYAFPYLYIPEKQTPEPYISSDFGDSYKF